MECQKLLMDLESKECQLEQMEGLVSQMEAEMAQVKENFRLKEQLERQCQKCLRGKDIESIISEEEQRACTPVFEVMAPYNTGPSDSEVEQKPDDKCMRKQHHLARDETLTQINNLFFSKSQDHQSLQEKILNKNSLFKQLYNLFAQEIATFNTLEDRFYTMTQDFGELNSLQMSITKQLIKLHSKLSPIPLKHTSLP